MKNNFKRLLEQVLEERGKRKKSSNRRGVPNTRDEAIKRDKKGEAYVDEETPGDFTVFGSESGFAYSVFTDKKEAEKFAKKINKEIKSSK